MKKKSLLSRVRSLVPYAAGVGLLFLVTQIPDSQEEREPDPADDPEPASHDMIYGDVPHLPDGFVPREH